MFACSGSGASRRMAVGEYRDAALLLQEEVSDLRKVLSWNWCRGRVNFCEWILILQDSSSTARFDRICTCLLRCSRFSRVLFARSPFAQIFCRDFLSLLGDFSRCCSTWEFFLFYSTASLPPLFYLGVQLCTAVTSEIQKHVVRNFGNFSFSFRLLRFVSLNS